MEDNNRCFGPILFYIYIYIYLFSLFFLCLWMKPTFFSMRYVHLKKNRFWKFSPVWGGTKPHMFPREELSLTVPVKHIFTVSCHSIIFFSKVTTVLQMWIQNFISCFLEIPAMNPCESEAMCLEAICFCLSVSIYMYVYVCYPKSGKMSKSIH